MREQGYDAEVVERWVPGANVRHDLFGFIDIIAFRGAQVIGIQATTMHNMAARYKKILDNPIATRWLAAGCEIRIVGWRKFTKKVNGKLWHPSEINVLEGEIAYGA